MRKFGRKIVGRLLEGLSRWALLRHKPELIAISGSVGKSSAREAIFRVLSSHQKIRRDTRGYNNRLGLELSVLGIESGGFSAGKWIPQLFKAAGVLLPSSRYPEIILSVVAADRPGSVDDILRLLTPKCLVIMNIGKTHLEYYSGIDTMVVEHLKIANAVSEDGYVILSADNPHADALRENLHRKVLTFGKEERADFMAEVDEASYVLDADRWLKEGRKTRTNLNFKVSFRGTRIPVRLPNMIGLHMVYPALAALAMGKVHGISLEEGASCLMGMMPLSGRLKPLRGKKNTLIIDNTYVASELALSNALDCLRMVKTSGRKILILGDMTELGVYTERAHINVGEQAAEVVDKLFTVGFNTEFAGEGYLNAGKTSKDYKHFSGLKILGRFLEDFIKPNDVLLFSASQGVRLEQVIKRLMWYTNEVPKVLVRQEPHWQSIPPLFP